MPVHKRLFFIVKLGRVGCPNRAICPTVPTRTTVAACVSCRIMEDVQASSLRGLAGHPRGVVSMGAACQVGLRRAQGSWRKTSTAVVHAWPLFNLVPVHKRLFFIVKSGRVGCPNRAICTTVGPGRRRPRVSHAESWKMCKRVRSGDWPVTREAW